MNDYNFTLKPSCNCCMNVQQSIDKHPDPEFEGWFDKLITKSRQAEEAAKFPFQCEVCLEVFASLQHRNIHSDLCKTKNSLLNDEKKKTRKLAEALVFECAVCSRYIKYKGGFKRHMKLHEDDPVECPECHKIFQNTTKLKRHDYNTHKKSRMTSQTFKVECE